MVATSPHKVVVVDENHTQIALYQRSVTALVVELVAFDSPDESIAYLRENSTDLLLLDLAMTENDGLSWLREMRNIKRHAETPVVVVTSKDYAQDRIVAKKLGAIDYLVKPLRSQEIREIICAHIKAQFKDDGLAVP